MWKNGQLVTLWGNVYRIKKCAFYQQQMVCAFCQQVNGKTPCTKAYDYPNRLDGFGFADCVLKVPVGHFPKNLKPKQ